MMERRMTFLETDAQFQYCFSSPIGLSSSNFVRCDETTYVYVDTGTLNSKAKC